MKFVPLSPYKLSASTKLNLKPIDSSFLISICYFWFGMVLLSWFESLRNVMPEKTPYAVTTTIPFSVFSYILPFHIICLISFYLLFRQ